MKRLSAALANESVLLLGLTAAILTALHVEKEWQDVVQAAIPLLLALAVRQITSSPKTVAEAVTTAAAHAALDTAEQLNSGTAGTVGVVTAKGHQIVEDIVPGVAEKVLTKVGGLVKAIAPDPREITEDAA